MASINKLMKQAMRAQQQAQETEAALATRTVEATSGGGAVKVRPTASAPATAGTVCLATAGTVCDLDPGCARARQRAAELVGSARGRLERLPEGPWRDALFTLSEFVLERRW